jgi:hypothetical protein
MPGLGMQQYAMSGMTNHIPGLSPAAIKYRLDNSDMLRDIELYLRSAKVVGKELADGTYAEEMKQIGRPMANEDGIQGIMGYLRIMISPHNVQGNLTWDRYDFLIYEIHVDLATTLMGNRRNWGISIEDYDIILNNIMHTLQLFLSRTVENKERESYGESIRSDERTVLRPNEKKGWFGGMWNQ